MIGGRSALLAASGLRYGNWTGNYSDVSLLLRGGVPVLAPIDESPTSKTLTVVGNAGISTTTFKYGNSSLIFDGSGDYLDTLSTTDFDFANNPFTIEAWIYTTGIGSIQGIFSNMNNGSNATLGGYVLYIETSGQIVFADYSNGLQALVLSSSANVTANQWQHVVVCKEGIGTNQLRMFINGNIVASGTRNAIIPVAVSGQPGRVGAWRFPNATRSFNGFINDLRITRGITRYVEGTATNVGKMVFAGTNNLALPTAQLPANITDDPSYNSVSLLLRGGGGVSVLALVDESPTSKTLTVVGNAGISTTTFKYGNSSLTFDGSGDYIFSPANAGFEFGLGDFTIEAWVRMPSISGTIAAIVMYTQSGIYRTDVAFAVFIRSPGVLETQLCSGSNLFVTTSSVAIQANRWHHVAVVRNAGQVTCYVDGFGGSAINANATLNSPASRLLRIGADVGDSAFFNGQIDDLRITKNFARYVKNFLPPPAQLPAI